MLIAILGSLQFLNLVKTVSVCSETDVLEKDSIYPETSGLFE